MVRQTDWRFLVSLVFLGSVLICLPILGVKAFYLQEEKKQNLAFEQKYKESGFVLGESLDDVQKEDFSGNASCDTRSRSDIDCSGRVDLIDFTYWLENYKLALTPQPTREPGPQPTREAGGCNSKCVSQGYSSGYCDEAAVYPGLETCKAGEINIGDTEDCFVPLGTYGTRRDCCCVPDFPVPTNTPAGPVLPTSTPPVIGGPTNTPAGPVLPTNTPAAPGGDAVKEFNPPPP